MVSEGTEGPLLAPLTGDQQALIEAVAAGFFQIEQWPDWEFVDETLDGQGIDAAKVWAGLPREHTHGYSYVSRVQMVPRPDSEIALTIAGLSETERGQGLVGHFLRFVSALGAAREVMPPVPRRDAPPSISRTELSRTLAMPQTTAIEQFVLDALTREPSTWRCERSTGQDGEWTITLPAQVRRYAGVNSVEDYLHRLRDQIHSVEEPSGRSVAPPFTPSAPDDELDATTETDGVVIASHEALQAVEVVLTVFQQRVVDTAEFENLASEEKLEATAEIETLTAQIHSPRPKTEIIRGALSSLGQIFKNAVAGAGGVGIVEAIQTALRVIH
jgi:hypothetical protein